MGSIEGAAKLARNGFVTYGEQDGILGVLAIFPDGAGGACFKANLYAAALPADV